MGVLSHQPATLAARKHKLRNRMNNRIAPLLVALASVPLLCPAPPAAADIDVSSLASGSPVSELVQTLQSAEQGDAEAQFRMGVRYDSGNGVERSFAEAARWYRRASEQGHAAAQTNLGLMYSEGQGVPRDNREAARWLSQAAQADDPLAQYSLALLYHRGNGVEKDPERALQWYREAARAGYPQALNNIGIMYGLGEGVAKSEVEALAWFLLGASRGDPDATRNRDLTAAEMSDEAVQQSRTRAQELAAQLSGS